MRNRLVFVVLLLIPLLMGCISQRSGVSWPHLTVVNESAPQLLVSYEDFMVLLDAETGNPIQLLNSAGDPRVDEDGNALSWEINGDDADGARFYTSPIFMDDEMLMVANYNNMLLTANFPNSRVVNPSLATIPGHVIAEMVVSEGVLYIPLSNVGLVAVNYDNPTEELWRFEVDRGVWSSPVLVDGVIYVGSVNHYLYAIDATTGEEIWSLDLGGAVASSPYYLDGHLYVGTFSHDIYDISTEGEILSQFEANDWIWDTPIFYDDTLYVADLSGWVYALSISDGLEMLWQVQVSERGIRPSPIVTEDYVIVANRDGRIFWLDRTNNGQPVMVDGEDGLVPLQRDVDAEVLSDMVLIDFEDENEADLLIVSTTNKGRLLIAFTINDGERRWGYGR